jgi:hypothetical protein
VADDIVTRLRKMNYYVNEVASNLPDEAADEIERLRTALQLAVGELSTYNEYRLVPPDMLYQYFLKEARHD